MGFGLLDGNIKDLIACQEFDDSNKLLRDSCIHILDSGQVTDYSSVEKTIPESVKNLL